MLDAAGGDKPLPYEHRESSIQYRGLDYAADET